MCMCTSTYRPLGHRRVCAPFHIQGDELHHYIYMHVSVEFLLRVLGLQTKIITTLLDIMHID